MEPLPMPNGGVMVVGRLWSTWTAKGERFWRDADTGVVCTRGTNGAVLELRYTDIDAEPVWVYAMERAS